VEFFEGGKALIRLRQLAMEEVMSE
ncbi:hypothetical protein Tco_1443005, partial [Tanacetum coccineum]